MSSSTLTIGRFLVEEERKLPDATGVFTGLLWDLTIAFKIISREVNKAGLVDILGKTGDENVHGEEVRKLDEFAHYTLFKAMDHGGHLCAMASEEDPKIMRIPKKFKKGKYVLIFDPLDGSSNIDANVSIGSIFSILRKVTPGEDGTLEDCLQPGYQQIAAGYCVYGSSTIMVYSSGTGVNGFTLDPSIGEFLISHRHIEIPKRGSIYSINEGYSDNWDEGTKRFIQYLKTAKTPEGKSYSMRYIGSLVADFHRNLLYGGIFLYPAVYKDPESPPKAKLRLLYEANPLAFVVEKAGGKATTGTQDILQIEPESLHQRVPLIIGSADDVDTYLKFMKEYSPAQHAT
ncbi:MAG TPA: class 1 fructose-bisphosphatase [Acidobacteriota bacterium]|nr:class 1 fructose-bisphosphatase [Acidobacteriota bacterium]